MTNLGPAVVGTTVVTGCVAAGKAYTVTRAIRPAVLGVCDLQVADITNVELPTGHGAWASALADGVLYIGTYEPGEVYRYDTATGQLDLIAHLPESYVWDLATTPAGTLYAGTYPSGSVYRIDPATGDVDDLGPAKEGEQYVRSIAADDATVYAGVGSHAALVAVDQTTGARRDILPAELAREAFVYDVEVTDTQVIGGTYPGGCLVAIDKRDPSRHVVTRVDGAKGVDKLVAAASGVYLTAQDSGAVYRYDSDAGGLTLLGTPSAGDVPTGGLDLVDGTLWGFGFSGVLWSIDAASGAVERQDLVAAGLRAGPEAPQAMAVDNDERVYVGGTGALRIHEVRSGSLHDVRVSGEPKAMSVVDHRLYMAMYPSGAITSYDPATDLVRVEAVIGHEQIRPRDQVYEPVRDLLLIGTQPDYGKLGGALAVYGTRSGVLEVHRGVIADQSVSSVAVDGGVVYLGGEVHGGAGAQPVATEGVLAAFDLDTRTKLWEIVPVAGAAAIRHLAVLDGRIHGTTERGTFFVVDPVRRVVVHSRSIGGGEVKLVAKGGLVYGASHEQVVAIDPGTYAVRVVVDDLDAEKASYAQLSSGEEGSSLVTLTGRDLLRVELA